MTAITDDLEQAEIERSNLQRAISDVETVNAVSTPGTRSIFDNFLQNARGRLATLEKRIKDKTEEKESQAREQVVIAYIAEKEAALDAHEQRTYDGFLKEEYFSKEDFGRLEEFYAHAYDRLSEHGKEELSHRIWEGVRRDEYKFTDLPKVVQEKETDRAYAVLKKREVGTSKLAAIPESDRQDFISAYEAGHKEQAEKILDRKSFRENMSISAPSKERTDKAVTSGQTIDKAAVEKDTSVEKQRTDPPPQSGGKADLDLSAANLRLNGVKSADNQQAVAATNIPANATPQKDPALSRG